MKAAYLFDEWSPRTAEVLGSLAADPTLDLVLVQLRKEKHPRIPEGREIPLMSLSAYLHVGRSEDYFLIDSYPGLGSLDKIHTRYAAYLGRSDRELSMNAELSACFKAYLDKLPLLQPQFRKEKAGASWLTEQEGAVREGGYRCFSEDEKDIFRFITEKLDKISDIEKGYVWTREQYLHYKNLNVFTMIARKIRKIFKGA